MRDHHAATLPTTTPRISHESGKLTLDFVDHPAVAMHRLATHHTFPLAVDHIRTLQRYRT